MLNITELRKKYLSGEVTPTDFIETTLAEIHSKNKDINAFLEIFDDVKAEAELATKRFVEEGDKTPFLLGVPIAIKKIKLKTSIITGNNSMAYSDF